MKISNERKKELLEQYKLMRPDMGVFAVVRKDDFKYYVELARDLKSVINSTKFKLNAGMHPNRELQKDWDELGPEGFEIKVLGELEYDGEDETKVDYEDDLGLLKMMWIKRLNRENIELY